MGVGAFDPTALGYVALSSDAKVMAQDMYSGSLVFSGVRDRNRPCESGDASQPDTELAGLVYGLTEVPSLGEVPFYEKPLFWAAVVINVSKTTGITDFPLRSSE